MEHLDPLREGDLIGVTACSDGGTEEVDKRRFDSAAEQFAARGFRVRETENVRTGEKGRSSSARERARQLQSLVEDEEVKLILLASGGDYLAEMLPYVDFEEIRRHPKWYQGYSDPTGLLFSIATKCGVPTVYGSNYGDFGMRPWDVCLERNLEVLTGRRTEQENFTSYQDGFLTRETGYETYRKDRPTELRALFGESSCCMRGRLLGGCLDVLLDLIGTPYEAVESFIETYRQDGIVWYLESFALNSERLTIALWHLKEAGWFRNASGILFGRPAFFESGTETSFEEAVQNALGELRIPILTGVDVGHKPPYLTMINGALAEAEYRDGALKLRQRL